MVISIISAMDRNGVIGFNNEIPWKGVLPKDLSWFKSKTINKSIIMGYKTFKSIGKPLNNRINIVLSYQHHIKNTNIIKHARTLEQALSFIKNSSSETIIIGGSKTYETFFPLVFRLYLTKIDSEIKEGDSFFPRYLIIKKEWKTVFREYHKADKDNFYNFKFEILERKNSSSLL